MDDRISVEILLHEHCSEHVKWMGTICNPELDLKEGTIGIKIVGLGNKRMDSNSPCISMRIPNLIWLRKLLVFEKLATTSNVCMDALNRVHIHVFIHCCKKRVGQKWIKMQNLSFERLSWPKTIGSDLIPAMLLTYQI